MSDKDGHDTVVHQAGGDSVQKKGHFKRFWWAYLIGLIVVVVIVVPVLILVAIPKIAQSKIDAAELEVRAISALNTQSDNFTMTIDSVIRTDGSVHADIAPFTGVMYLEDWAPQRPFAKINFPATTSDAYQEVKVTQFVDIEDMDAFTVFNTWLLLNDTLRVTILGDTSVRVKGIARDYPVTFKKTTEMPGLRGFAGTVVEDPKISLNASANGGRNFAGTAIIPNYSKVTFEIGNATFFNYLNGEDVGEVFIDNMTLRPGNNSFSMSASVNQIKVLTALQARPACETGTLPFGLRGKTILNNGQPLSYFRDALAAANQTVEIAIAPAVKAATGLNIGCSSSTAGGNATAATTTTTHSKRFLQRFW